MSITLHSALQQNYITTTSKTCLLPVKPVTVEPVLIKGVALFIFLYWEVSLIQGWPYFRGKVKGTPLSLREGNRIDEIAQCVHYSELPL